MKTILPARCYAGIDADSIKHTEVHLARVLKLKVIQEDDSIQRYVRRMSECRPSRRCNLSACPSCEVARQDRMVAEVLTEVRSHPRPAILSVDVLFPPRDLLRAGDRQPRDDLKDIRRVIRTELPNSRSTRSYLYLLGRYEVAVKRPTMAAFLRNFAPGKRSRSVVPHVHFVTVAKEGGTYLTAPLLRERLKSHFPEPRQLMVRNLMPSQPTEEALAKRVCYVFKKKTSEFTGRVLLDFVHCQMLWRQDAWTLRYRNGLPAHAHASTASFERVAP